MSPFASFSLVLDRVSDGDAVFSCSFDPTSDFSVQTCATLQAVRRDEVEVGLINRVILSLLWGWLIFGWLSLSVVCGTIKQSISSFSVWGNPSINDIHV